MRSSRLCGLLIALALLCARVQAQSAPSTRRKPSPPARKNVGLASRGKVTVEKLDQRPNRLSTPGGPRPGAGIATRCAGGGPAERGRSRLGARRRPRSWLLGAAGLLLSVAIPPAPLLAQERALRFDRVTVEDGLSHASVGRSTRTPGASCGWAREKGLLDELFELSRVGGQANPPEELAFGDLVREALAQLAATTASASIRSTATRSSACSSASTRRTRKAPASAWRWSSASSRSTAAGSGSSRRAGGMDRRSASRWHGWRCAFRTIQDHEASSLSFALSVCIRSWPCSAYPTPRGRLAPEVK